MLFRYCPNMVSSATCRRCFSTLRQCLRRVSIKSTVRRFGGDSAFKRPLVFNKLNFPFERKFFCISMRTFGSERETLSDSGSVMSNYVGSKLAHAVTQQSTPTVALHSTPTLIPQSTYSANDASSHSQMLKGSPRTELSAPKDESIAPGAEFTAPEAQFDWSYLCNPENTEKLRQNIKNRKDIGDIDEVINLWKKLNQLPQHSQLRTDVLKELLAKASELPNFTHPDVPIGDESKARVISTCQIPQADFPGKSAVEIGEDLDLLHINNVGYTSGPRTYYLKGVGAQLEDALVRYTLDNIISRGFEFISVPDLIHPAIIEGCGFKTVGPVTQVYRLDPTKHRDICLAGTGEIPIAGFLTNQIFPEGLLPKRLCTVSRCYRPEVSECAAEQGIYRVHQFTKVEMFAVTANSGENESSQMMEKLRNVQEELFSQLQMPFRVLDMPSQELGAPAYRKYDIEAWMPGRKAWGEISSTSNCLDYQSRRLNIKYEDNQGNIHFCHTVNGTACAVPRMIIAILENNQQKDGTVLIPEKLHPYMDKKEIIDKPTKKHHRSKFMTQTKNYKRKTAHD